MGEYVWTSYNIGGKLPRAKLDEFKKFIEAYSEYDASDDPEKSIDGSFLIAGFDENVATPQIILEALQNTKGIGAAVDLFWSDHPTLP